MKEHEMSHVRILGIDNDEDVLSEMESEICSTWPGCFFDKAVSYDEGIQLMLSYTYHLVIADPMNNLGVRLIDQAKTCQFPVLALVDTEKYAWGVMNPQVSPVRAIVPKNSVHEIKTVIEDILESGHTSTWKRGLSYLAKHFKPNFSRMQAPKMTHGIHPSSLSKGQL
jgi:hypothetical protein